mmetsp:Transcript_57658/g.166987  ORF Transcript_57658/g.166987 Transcript_57658/m.166987 type:complete len:280 (+) Transcript_57658:264-1103(+)
MAAGDPGNHLPLPPQPQRGRAGANGPDLRPRLALGLPQCRLADGLFLVPHATRHPFPRVYAQRARSNAELVVYHAPPGGLRVALVRDAGRPVCAGPDVAGHRPLRDQAAGSASTPPSMPLAAGAVLDVFLKRVQFREHLRLHHARHGGKALQQGGGRARPRPPRQDLGGGHLPVFPLGPLGPGELALDRARLLVVVLFALALRRLVVVAGAQCVAGDLRSLHGRNAKRCHPVQLASRPQCEPRYRGVILVGGLRDDISIELRLPGLRQEQVQHAAWEPA